MRTIATAALLAFLALPAQAQDAAIESKVDAVVKAMFTRVSPDWQARTVLDETQRICTVTRNMPSAAQADEIQKREMTKVKFPADGKLTGDWKKGFQVANNGRGGQFSDGKDTVAGGNCYACHQMDPKEVSYGTLGPSLAAYGKDRGYDAEAMKQAWTKIWNSQAVVACSNMPRFGSMDFLTEQQIKDVVAYLFDRESPVNK